jgi:hypothetical protein
MMMRTKQTKTMIATEVYTEDSSSVQEAAFYYRYQEEASEYGVV